MCWVCVLGVCVGCGEEAFQPPTPGPAQKVFALGGAGSEGEAAQLRWDLNAAETQTGT